MARKKIEAATTKTARVTEATVTLMGEFEELRKRADQTRIPPSLRRALEDSGVQATGGARRSSAGSRQEASSWGAADRSRGCARRA